MPPQSLVDAVKNRTCVPFVGSGLSVSVGRGLFPDWSGLIDRLAARLDAEGLPGAADVRTHHAAKRFPEAAELAFETLKPGRFGVEMQAAFDVPPPHDVDLSAVEALWSLKPRTVITTNYDAVLRWPFAPRAAATYQIERTPPRVVHNDDQDLLQLIVTPSAAADRPLIWHLHGSVDRPKTLILTERQYQRLYGAGSDQAKEYAFALQQLQTLVANRTLFFVGFSLDDPFIRAQLEHICEVTAKLNPVSFVLLKAGEKDTTSLLDRYHVQVIEFEQFGDPMALAISDIAFAAFGQRGVSVSVPSALQGVVDDLTTLLRRSAPEPAVVGRAFNRWRPRAWPAFPLGGDGVGLAVAAADKLANAMRQSGGYYPLLEFVREIAARSPGQRGVLLRAWLTAAAAAFGADADDAAYLEGGGFVAPDSGGSADHYVLLRLEEDGADMWRGQAWLFSGSEPEKLFQDERHWTRAGFPTLIYQLLDQVAALDLPPDRTTVGFMVPRALLVEAIDQLEPAVEFAREPPIGVTLPFTVRSVERLRHATNMRRLGTTWQALKAMAASAWTLGDALPVEAAGGAVWLTPADAGPDLVERLRQNHVVCAVLALPPLSEAADAATDLFNCVLQAAVPAALWLRQPAAADLAAARAQVTALLGAAAPPLPQRVWQLRQAARGDRDPAHPGQCLVLFWDDADRLPPDQDPVNRAVVPRA